jgi:hypothetical protein
MTYKPPQEKRNIGYIYIPIAVYVGGKNTNIFRATDNVTRNHIRIGGSYATSRVVFCPDSHATNSK